jgi:hypothetical protein
MPHAQLGDVRAQRHAELRAELHARKTTEGEGDGRATSVAWTMEAQHVKRRPAREQEGNGELGKRGSKANLACALACS